MPHANPDDAKAYRANRYAKRKAAGMCNPCGKPVRKGKTQCAKCAAKSNARHTERKAAGTCASCPAPARKGKTRCAKCAAKATDRSVERTAAGLCTRCGKPARSGKTLCAKCSAKINDRDTKRYAKIKANGLCRACGKPSRKGKVHCADCASKRNARYATLNAQHRAERLLVIYANQQGKCGGCQHPYPQRNLTVDHIVPRARGGEDEPSNLQLLCHYCNSTKGDRPQSALIVRLRELGIIDDAGKNIEIPYQS